jgi:hypothetical protein
MKPKPFASLNHFTVPEAMCWGISFLSVKRDTDLPRAASALPSGREVTMYLNRASKSSPGPENPRRALEARQAEDVLLRLEEDVGENKGPLPGTREPVY